MGGGKNETKSVRVRVVGENASKKCVPLRSAQSQVLIELLRILFFVCFFFFFVCLQTFLVLEHVFQNVFAFRLGSTVVRGLSFLLTLSKREGKRDASASSQRRSDQFRHTAAPQLRATKMSAVRWLMRGGWIGFGLVRRDTSKRDPIAKATPTSPQAGSRLREENGFGPGLVAVKAQLPSPRSMLRCCRQ